MRKQVAMFLKIRTQVLLILLLTAFLNQSCVAKTSSTSLPAAPAMTKTMTPNAAITPSRTSAPAVTTTATPDYAATLDFIETASINTIVSTVQPLALASYLSPDGNWRVEIIRYECINYPYQDYMGNVAYEQLNIINLSNGTEQIVDDQLQNCDGIGGGGLNGLYWSPSNRYFYYTDWREGYPESCGNYIVPTVYRLDTLSKETIMVGGGHISPDKTKLAMWESSENEIVIWDLDKGEAGRITALKPDLFRGQILWSSDSQSLQYWQTESGCAPDYGKLYITRLDLRNYSQSLLGEYDSSGKENAVTPVPSDVFALIVYRPLIMNFDPSVWTDESHYVDARYIPAYAVTNYLRALNLETCKIGVQGPTGDFLFTPEAAQLGSVNYEVITFTDTPSGLITAYYIENNSLAGFDYEAGAAVLTVQASSPEWNECKTLAEKVLSTLRVP